jgi:DNA-binding NarL/FixJ family response regulator
MSQGQAIRVFILDDHELVRRGLGDLLRDAGGFDVVGESASAQEAIRRAPALRPDVALLDVQLPDGSGIEVCRRLRAHDPRIRTLMVTSFDDAESQLAAVIAGASGVVLKQLRGNQLTDAIRRVAAGESLLDRATAEDVVRRARTQDSDELRWAHLTGQQQRILDLIVEGLSNREIGHRLNISEKTVKNHVTTVLGKLGFVRRTQAAVFAARLHDR